MSLPDALIAAPRSKALVGELCPTVRVHTSDFTATAFEANPHLLDGPQHEPLGFPSQWDQEIDGFHSVRPNHLDLLLRTTLLIILQISIKLRRFLTGLFLSCFLILLFQRRLLHLRAHCWRHRRVHLSNWCCRAR